MLLILKQATKLSVKLLLVIAFRKQNIKATVLSIVINASKLTAPWKNL